MCQYIPSLHMRLRVVARLRRWRFQMAACWPEVCQISSGGWPMVLMRLVRLLAGLRRRVPPPPTNQSPNQNCKRCVCWIQGSSRKWLHSDA
ncbi:hypothetical protein P8452_53171 [Trifolium repens]|nr:hypothetical protein P8452_53171 [Trifolium repens]